MRHSVTTITITVNVASANKEEGNSSMVINLLHDPQYNDFNPADYAPEIEHKVNEAISDYRKRNHGARVYNGRNIAWNGEGYYGFSEIGQSWGRIADGKVRNAELMGTKVVYIYASDVR